MSIVNRQHLLTSVIGASFFILILGYAYYESRALIAGPKVSIHTPALPVVSTSDQTLIVSGTVSRITELLLNGRQLATTEDGSFADLILLAPGYNRISLVAVDRAGHKTTEHIDVVYRAPVASTNDQTLPIIE